MPERCIPSPDTASATLWGRLVLLLATVFVTGRVAYLAIATPVSDIAIATPAEEHVTDGPIRLVSAETPAAETWLVAPEAWFAPEDGDQPEPATPPQLDPIDPPAVEPPATTPLPTLDGPPAAAPVTPEPSVVVPGPPQAIEFEPNALSLPEPPQLSLPNPAARQPSSEAEPPPAPVAKPPPAPAEPLGPGAIEPPSIERARVGSPSIEPPPAEPEPAEPTLPEPVVETPAAAPRVPAVREPVVTEPIEPPPAPPEPIAKPAPLFTAPLAPNPVVAAPVTPHGSPHGSGPAKPLTPEQQKLADESHRDLFAKNCYPSATECAKCHKKQYEEWRISSHAYAFVSPMFQKFEQTISKLSQGTVGYFCFRCHSPVGTTMGVDRAEPMWQMPKVAREGVTCIVCHRVNEQYARNNGERRIVPGPLTDPVYGGIGGEGVAKAIADKKAYKVKTSPDEPGAGQVIHNEGRFFQQLSHAEFCTSCHQVAVHPGIKLEVVWDQYRRSPACKKGVTCQDCHMGREPGVPSGYEITSIAEVGGKSVNNKRKHANHIFYGPHYSIAHPGIFPQHEKADRWTMDEWLLFDWRAGWGTDDFEDAVEEGRRRPAFPKVWSDVDDRYDAREIVEDNLKGIGKKRVIRQEVMEHSLKIAGPFFKHAPRTGADLNLHYDVTNLNEGHNVLTASLGAQPQLWANVALIGPDGRRLWETGYTDTDGDVCDIHSRDVRTGRMPFDRQLFNLQTMFLITGATGTDRELPLPVNVDIDQLPFLRPGTIPISVTNHPPFIRMESRSLSPLGTKRVKYQIPGHLIRQPGRYRLTFRMRNRIEPIYFMRFCDATDEMVRSMNEGILDVGVRSAEFWVR